ncbi:Mor transcription activator family protein [uncultured Aquitalea sp.]|uniref:Mor transcription activator family protein n=1 Tax=uncultured Aquitalea sp. TaxID=540272 RepID=UPI0025E1D5AF|nr:Mor transcription activator family protein [uncultured Aquitalea sp.]
MTHSSIADMPRHEVQLSAIEERYLPTVLQEIANLIGLPATLVLVRTYGGRRMYVPKRFDPDHPIVKLLGHEAAAKLIEVYGGLEHFDLPKGEVAIKAARDRQIRLERAGGSTYATLALRFALTERQIRNICGPELDDRQADLF